MSSDNYAVIMAGGVGSRFWPASTQKMPKQFLPFFGKKSLIQQTVDRISPLVPIQRILIVTNASYADIISTQLPTLPKDNILCEPMPKNTAPCVLLATRRIRIDNPNAVVAVLPADHYISQPEAYLEHLAAAFEQAKSQKTLTTIGIQPHRIETGYGYIKYKADTQTMVQNQRVFDVEAFTEKPDYEKAKAFIADGSYLWNSGMFIWSNDVIDEAFKSYAKDLSTLADTYLKKPEDFEVSAKGIQSFFEQAQSISIDYAIMEKAKKASVLPGVFGWNDVGSWQAVYELEDKDPLENASNVPLRAIDSKNNLVRLQSGKEVALLGIDGLAIVETENELMIADLNRSQEVKKFSS